MESNASSACDECAETTDAPPISKLAAPKSPTKIVVIRLIPEASSLTW
jgi:hypothetical protein